MATRGRWGVTREDNGELALLWEWPWYWRYPGGFAIAAAGIWVALMVSDDGQLNWESWVSVGVGIFLALWTMYELGCLIIVLAVLGGSYIGLTTLFPALKVDWSLQSAAVGAALVYAFWLIDKYTKRLQKAEQALQKAERDITALQNRLLNYRRNDHL